MKLTHLTLCFTTLALSSCSSCEDDHAAAAGGSQITFAPVLGVDLATMAKTPSGAWYKDLTAGDGAPVGAGKHVAIHYDGRLPNGARFDVNGPTDQPFAFVLGVGAVVRGFDEGVAGMKVGGRRLVVIPPELGYGPQGNGPVPPNATLVFTIELVSAR